MHDNSLIDRLAAVIAARKAQPVDSRSYVRSLLNGGESAIGAKIVEEAAEVVEASHEPGDAGRSHLIREVADLVFHILVMLGHKDIAWAEVEAELARRFGVSGIDEKASRDAKPPSAS